jgi:O-antigen ligase
MERFAGSAYVGRLQGLSGPMTAFVLLTGAASIGLVFQSGLLFGIVVAVSAYSLIAAIIWPWMPMGVFLLSMPLMLVELAGGIQVVHVLGASVALGVIWAQTLSDKGLQGSPILFGGALMVTAFLLSSLTGVNPLASLRLGSIGFVGFALACAIVQIAPNRTGLIWIMRCWIFGALISIGPFLFQDHSLSVEYGGTAVRGRVSGVFGQPNYMVEVSLFTIFVSLALIWACVTRFDRVLATVAVLVSLAGAVLTLSRGGLMGIAAATLVLAILVPRVWKAVVAVTVGLAALFAAGLAAGWPLVLIVIQRLGSVSEAGTGPADERPLAFAEAWRWWTQEQVLGIGPGGFLEKSSVAGSILAPRGFYHAHNFVLHIGVEGGLVGLIAFTAATVIGITMTLRAIYGGRPTVLPAKALAALLAGLAGAAVHGMVDFLFSNVVMIALLSVYLGLIAAGVKPYPPQVERFSSDDPVMSGAVS